MKRVIIPDILTDQVIEVEEKGGSTGGSERSRTSSFGYY